MAKIVKIADRITARKGVKKYTASAQSTEQATGQVLLFTGVQYERIAAAGSHEKIQKRKTMSRTSHRTQGPHVRISDYIISA